METTLLKPGDLNLLDYLKRTKKRIHHVDANYLFKVDSLNECIGRLREAGNEIESEIITTVGTDNKERYHTEYWIK